MSQNEAVLNWLKREPITPAQALAHIGLPTFEEWKDAGVIDPRLDGYEVSSLGRIKSKERMVNHPKGGLKIVRERILKTASSPGGYQSVCLKKRGTHLIHRLVAIAFIPNESLKPCVNHIDGNKGNNTVENLEWCTYSENEKHSYLVLNKKPSKTSLGKFGELNTGSKRVAARNRSGKIIHAWGGASEAARKLDSSQGHISAICRGERPSTFGYSLEYISNNEYENYKSLRNEGHKITAQIIESPNGKHFARYELVR